MTAAADWATDPSLLPVGETGGLLTPGVRFALGGLFALLVARVAAIHRYRWRIIAVLRRGSVAMRQVATRVPLLTVRTTAREVDGCQSSSEPNT
jgi:hypothetical protein